MDEVRIRVPASTSNLGPGLDTLGLALDWHLTASAKKGGAALEIEVSYPGPPEWEGPLKEMAGDAVRLWEEKSGKSAGGLLIRMEGDIRLAHGLGSSAAYRLAAVSAVNALAGAPLNEPAVLDLVCGMEGHTDNTTPSMVGGLTVSGWVDDRVHFVRYPAPDRYRFVALIPERELATAEARKLLPDQVPRQDAVFNMQRALWLVNAIANDRPEELRRAFHDRLHQPCRQKLVPFLPRVIKAAEQAGAFGAFLSGAGSAVVAVTDEQGAPAVANAMVDTLEADYGKGVSVTLKPDNQGLRILGPD
jgi:homoserine kinase